MPAIQSVLAPWCEWGGKGFSLGTQLCSCPSSPTGACLPPLMAQKAGEDGHLTLEPKLDPSTPYWPLFPRAWSEGGTALWQGCSLGWPHSSVLGQLPARAQPRPARWGLRAAVGCSCCSGPWVQLRRSITTAAVGFWCCPTPRPWLQTPRWWAVTSAVSCFHRPWDWRAAAKHNSLWGMISQNHHLLQFPLKSAVPLPGARAVLLCYLPSQTGECGKCKIPAPLRSLSSSHI